MMKTIPVIASFLFSAACIPASDKAQVSVHNIAPLNDTAGLVPTAEMLDETLFWQIVDSSVNNSNNQQEQETWFVNKLITLTPVQIIGFRLRTDKLLYDTYTSEMWCAAHIMNGGCSDDGFEYFRNWVISKGKDIYYKAKNNPDALVTEDKQDLDVFEFESFWYVAPNAFAAKTGKDLYDYIDRNNFKTCEGNYPRITFTWAEDNAESMRQICPQLYKKYIGK